MTRDDIIKTLQNMDNIFHEPCTECGGNGRERKPKNPRKKRQCTKCRGSGKKPPDQKLMETMPLPDELVKEYMKK